jgi:protein TonB
MLEDSLFESNRRKKTRNPTTVVVSVVAHVVTVAVLVLIPLLQTHALVRPSVDLSLFLPKTESQPLIDAVAAPRPAPSSASAPSPVFTTPASIPPTIPLVDEPAAPEKGFRPLALATGIPLPFENFGSRRVEPPVPPQPPPVAPPPPPPAVKTDPLRIGGIVQAANLIHQVKPVYPPLARQARIQGVVVLEALIGKDGSISSLRQISGHPLLLQAALVAVKQWKYQPTLLNGDPTEVITTVTVTFTFQ